MEESLLGSLCKRSLNHHLLFFSLKSHKDVKCTGNESAAINSNHQSVCFLDMLKYTLSSSLECMTLLVTGLQERDAFTGILKACVTFSHTHTQLIHVFSLSPN